MQPQKFSAATISTLKQVLDEKCSLPRSAAGGAGDLSGHPATVLWKSTEAVLNCMAEGPRKWMH